MRETFGTMLVCEDIRYEINGKTSLMGIYENGIFFSKPAPAKLSKICFAANIWISSQYEVGLLKVVAQIEDGQRNISNISSTEIEVNHTPSEEEPEESFLNYYAHLTAYNVTFDGNSRLLLRAYFDDETVRCGTVQVNFPEQQLESESEAVHPERDA